MDSDMRLADLFAALGRARTRAETAAAAVRIAKAVPAASPDEVRELRERILSEISRLGNADDADDAFLLGLAVMLLDRVPAEREIAERQCPRCRARADALHVMLRPLNRFERRVCAQCLARHEAEGWHCVATDGIDLRCHACSQMAKPMHVVALVPAPIEAVACGSCADALGALGWRAAVTRSFF